MNPEAAKPRVNGSMLAKHIGCYVCLVGKNAGVGVAVLATKCVCSCVHVHM